MDSRINKNETIIQGKWIVKKGKVEKDNNCKRIEKLLASSLKEIKHSDDGWSILYQDSNDGRYWELRYLESEQHGGGPPSLFVLNGEDLRIKYGIRT